MSDFKGDIIIGVRKVDSDLSTATNFLGFSRRKKSQIFKVLHPCQNISSEKGRCGQKLRVNSRGARRLIHIVIIKKELQHNDL